jgi:hypothetical protein
MPPLKPDDFIALHLLFVVLTGIVPLSVAGLLYVIQRRIGAVDLKSAGVLSVMAVLCLLVIIFRGPIRDSIPRGLVLGLAHSERWIPVCLLVQMAGTGVLVYWMLRAWGKLRGIRRVSRGRTTDSEA